MMPSDTQIYAVRRHLLALRHIQVHADEVFPAGCFMAVGVVRKNRLSKTISNIPCGLLL